MPQRVEAGWVERRLEEGEVTLLAVLPKEAFEKAHLPGSVPVPAEESELARTVEKVVPDRLATVVVYGEGPDSAAVGRAARTLEALGYKRVFEFKAGLEGWRKTGHDVEKGHAAA
jgi:rhodanese-related sulfurtransferase